MAGLPPVQSLRPVTARHVEWSLICSADDLQPQHNAELLDTLLAAAEAAKTLSMDAVVARAATPEQATFLKQWPGEHYRLLAGIVQTLRPRRMIEVGTASGMSALALLHAAPAGAQLVTYDLLDWRSFPDTVLRQDDFASRLDQRLLDLSRRNDFHSQRAELASAELIFIDGPKDGQFERRFTDLLLGEPSSQSRVLVYDDIRVFNMLQFWRDLPLAKLDATSLGHWSGTGLAWLPAKAAAD